MKNLENISAIIFHVSWPIVLVAATVSIAANNINEMIECRRYIRSINK